MNAVPEGFVGVLESGPRVRARLARSTEDRRAAFQLRYEVYVAEQGKPYPSADHQQRLLSDDLDETAAIIVAEMGQIVAGTVRANWLDSAQVQQQYSDVSRFVHRQEVGPERVTVCSRLAVLPAYRKSQAGELLFTSIYEFALQRHTELCFATCTPPLVRLFGHYGFREYAAPIRDEVAGPLCRLLLILDDLPHLKAVDSPFAAIADRYGLRSQPRPWLDRKLSAIRPPDPSAWVPA
jgi:predicted GNAT family N-acyltransferase